MTRRALFSALVYAPIVLAQSSPDDLLSRSIRFNHHWGKFYRQLLGCPVDGKEISECKPQLGNTDVKEFRASESAAKTLFQLTDK